MGDLIVMVVGWIVETIVESFLDLIFGSNRSRKRKGKGKGTGTGTGKHRA